MIIEKHFGKDFKSVYGALTLETSAVTESNMQSGTHSRTHDSGWTITGEIHEDYFVWVNEFEATHPKFGRVWGDFEHTVYADSEEGFQHFWEHHEPEAWDYHDI